MVSVVGEEGTVTYTGLNSASSTLPKRERERGKLTYCHGAITRRVDTFIYFSIELSQMVWGVGGRHVKLGHERLLHLPTYSALAATAPMPTRTSGFSERILCNLQGR